MTDRLYYHDSFLYNFDGTVREVTETPRPALVLDRTAFYPTSGGQIFDTGWIVPVDDSDPARSSYVESDTRYRVTEVADREDGKVVHYIDAVRDIKPGTRIRGLIDPARRLDHMQQHSGQHVLSAAFVRLHNLHTVSFHMADDYCSIDLDTPTLTKEQVESAEKLANDIVFEDCGVEIRFVTHDEAAKLGLRKVPVADRDELRIIDIHDWDVSACGGTHVKQTGQIGCILLRKTERVRQGWRVEFVAGQRAVATARRDFATLTDAAALFSAHIYDVPQHAQKALEEIRSLRKQREQSQEELAEAQAAALLAETPEANGRRVILRTFSDRELNFLKLLAQKITRLSPNAVALLATTSPQPSLVFARSSSGSSASGPSAQALDMGALMKETMAKLGGRGGGSKDMAQGGIAQITPESLAATLEAVRKTLSA
jgi:alanyl-tRNA synthetase